MKSITDITWKSEKMIPPNNQTQNTHLAGATCCSRYRLVVSSCCLADCSRLLYPKKNRLQAGCKFRDTQNKPTIVFRGGGNSMISMTFVYDDDDDDNDEWLPIFWEVRVLLFWLGAPNFDYWNDSMADDITMAFFLHCNTHMGWLVWWNRRAKNKRRKKTNKRKD